MPSVERLPRRCCAPGCPKAAAVRVFDKAGHDLGDFCANCGNRKFIATMKEEEGIPKYGSLLPPGHRGGVKA